MKWTRELVIGKIREVMQELDVDRMPSRKECEAYFGNCALANVITKRFGWYNLADELGLQVKKSETQTGKTIERVVSDMLVERGFIVDRMPQNFPYDILVNGCVKVDVKSSHLYHGAHGNFYTFNLEKPFATCDVYILCELDGENNVSQVMVVPSKFVINNKQISVGEITSKYHAFTERWDYISNMVSFFSKMEV